MKKETKISLIEIKFKIILIKDFFKKNHKNLQLYFNYIYCFSGKKKLEILKLRNFTKI